VSIVLLEEWALDKYGKPIWPRLKPHILADLVVNTIEAWGEDDDDRRALEMWAWERATYAAIAKEFNLAGRPSGFYRVQRALKRLQQEIADDV